MSNVIPPLVCDTPPPMDYDENSPNCLDDADEFGDFETTDSPYTLEDATETMKSVYDPPVPEYELPKTPIHIPSNTSQISESPDPTTLPECDQAIRYSDAKTTDDINLIINFSKTNVNQSQTVPNSDDDQNNDEKITIETVETAIDDDIEQTTYEQPLSSDVVLSIDYYNENKFFPTDDDDYADYQNTEHYSSLPSLKLDSLNTSESNSPDSRSIKNEFELSENPLPNDLSIEYDQNDVDAVQKSDECNDFTADFSQFNDNPNEFTTDFTTDIEKQTKNQDQIEDDNHVCDSTVVHVDDVATANIDDVATANIDDVATPNIDDEDFDDFTQFSCHTDTIVDKIPTGNVIADDDDFGDFSDFTQSEQTATTSSLTTSQLQCGSIKINSILNMMFPTIELNVNETTNDDCSMEFNNATTDQVKNFENSVALEHQWLTSMGKNALVTALGIDKRNILYGGQWNSPMPRFAANLGFSPLEPMKSSNTGNSSAAATTTTTTTLSSTSFGEQQKMTKSTEIPAVQFDWTSSGLVNPLDGIQEILHKTSTAQDQPSRSEFNWSAPSAESPILLTAQQPTQQPPSVPATTGNSADSITILNQINNPMESNTELDTDDERTDIPAPVSSSYVIPGSGSLKETHIYTPDIALSNSSSSNHILVKDVVANDHVEQKKCPDFDYEKAAAGIIINENVVKKEYRDVEYNPDVLPSELSEFQSVPMNSYSPFNVGVAKAQCSDILQPTLANDFNWLEPAVQTNADASVTDLKLGHLNVGNNRKCQQTNGKPVIGVSPTDSMFTTSTSTVQQLTKSSELDDDFCDFQSVAPVPSSVLSTNSINMKTSSSPSVFPSAMNQINAPSIRPLSVIEPAILTPQLVNATTSPIQSATKTPNINWPDPGINPDELARLEAIFTVPNTTTIEVNSAVQPKDPIGKIEDDEWTDFVSSTPKPSSASIVKCKKPSVDDDWTDFVSGTPQRPSQYPSIVPIVAPPVVPAPTWNSGPNFTSWNAPPQFNSWQNSSLYKPPQSMIATIPLNNNFSQKFPPPNNSNNNNNNNTATTTTNNYNYNQNYNSRQQLQQKNSTPSISLLPDLSFIAPKTRLDRSAARLNYPMKK